MSYKIGQRRIRSPNYIYVAAVQQSQTIIKNNYGVVTSFVDMPKRITKP